MSLRYGIITILLCLCLPAAALAEDILLVADSWCPVNCDPDAERPGYAVEMAKAIFEPLGHDVTYELRPWMRARREVTEGWATGLIAATNEEGLVFPKATIGTLDNDYFTTKASNWKYSGPMSLSGKSVGIVAGYQYGDIEPLMSTTVRAYPISGTNVTWRSLDMLTHHRFDVLIEWAPVVIHTARRHGYAPNIRHAGRGGNAMPLYIAFTGDRPDLAKAWDEGMARLRQNGGLEEILGRYGLTMADCGL